MENIKDSKSLRKWKIHLLGTALHLQPNFQCLKYSSAEDENFISLINIKVNRNIKLEHQILMHCKSGTRERCKRHRNQKCKGLCFKKNYT